MKPSRNRSRGQVIVMFAAGLMFFIGLMAIVIDLSWYWANTLRVQRAADAAALAGAAYLPGNRDNAIKYATNEATKDGYTQPSPGCTSCIKVTPEQDSLVVAGGDPRQLDVTVSAPVNTFFMRAFGIGTINATRTAKAIYVQPVPMGSPLAYYGVYQDCTVTGATISCANIKSADQATVPGATLASQGFFGAIEGQGADRGTGDAFATGYNPDPTANDPAHSGGLIQSQYDKLGYYYQIEVPADGATVYVYDPTFCPTTSGPGGGHLGAGDHWLSTANHGAAVAVSTYYTLWNTQGELFSQQDWTSAGSSGTLFKSEQQVDKSTAYGKAAAAGGADSNYSDGTEPNLGSTPDCSSAAALGPAQGGYWHNKWWPIASGLAKGTYALHITTTDQTSLFLNQNQAFENMWSLQVVGAIDADGNGPQIYGQGRMVSYANIQAGQQEFYLAQIDRKSGAGKTIEIDLFDPGDVGDKAWLQILSPDGNVYTPAKFSYTADSAASSGHQSGSGVTCIQTYGNNTAISPPSGGNPSCAGTNYTSGGQFYGNSWIRITIGLPDTYGATGLTPLGEPAAGWWKIRYTVNKGNDTTTWMVNIRGNPVHLIVP